MNNTEIFDLVLEEEPTYTMSVASDQEKITLELDMAIEPQTPEIDPYDGPYEVTPTEDIQTLATDGKRMKDNVIVKPIPSNYGRITWNGAVLTVS